jgi:hypothetical protein
LYFQKQKGAYKYNSAHMKVAVGQKQGTKPRAPFIKGSEQAAITNSIV